METGASFCLSVLFDQKSDCWATYGYIELIYDNVKAKLSDDKAEQKEDKAEQQMNIVLGTEKKHSCLSLKKETNQIPAKVCQWPL